MVSAVVLLERKRNMINAVAETLAGIDGISEVFSVAGAYDLVVILRVRDNNTLADLVTSEMLQVDGIVDSGDADRVQGSATTWKACLRSALRTNKVLAMRPARRFFHQGISVRVRKNASSCVASCAVRFSGNSLCPWRAKPPLL